LASSLRAMKMVLEEGAVDGFELQLLPEWDSEGPPLTDAHFADWKRTSKYTVEEIARLLRSENLPILSVHSNRDVGNYLCSTQEGDVQKGKRLIGDSLSICQTLGAEVCVFHLWDTRKTSLDADHLRLILRDISHQYPGVKASVENIPTHLQGRSPFDLVSSFDSITLDTKWASLYGELDRFESVTSKIVNVHLRGKLEGDRWVSEQSSFSFYEAIDVITKKWNYTGPLTLEPDGRMNPSETLGFLKAMRSLPL
jgi:sugar phosphate isomerase/epimerase